MTAVSCRPERSDEPASMGKERRAGLRPWPGFCAGILGPSPRTGAKFRGESDEAYPRCLSPWVGSGCRLPATGCDASNSSHGKRSAPGRMTLVLGAELQEARRQPLPGKRQQ
jgi:hypothetical protein